MCLCVFHLCVFLHDNSKRNQSRNMKFEYIVVYNKAYRPNAHLLYTAMHYNGSIT